YFDSCANVPSTVRLVTKRNAYLYQANSGLFAGANSDDINRLFVYNAATQTLQAQGNGQCLGVYMSGNSPVLQLRACDSSANLKWSIDAATRKVKTLNNICLDVDPTNASRAAQVWTCFANNDNQVIDVVPY
ncbi:hypothetical protein SDRG_16648, partial [Saprolegnia diclina VS20]